MQTKLENKTLTLYFVGELNSYNSEDVEKDIEKSLEKQDFCSLILDFQSLLYISSAGLRVILKLKQKYKELSIINASLEVYDVLQMTGFTNIISVKKSLKKVNLDNAEVIGSGYFSTVYRIDKDTIIKVFNRTSDPEQIERELRLAKEAFISGIPTAISFDIVQAGEKLGVRFEMLDCESLKNSVVAHPEKLHEYLEKYVKLLKTITTTECLNPNIPSIKDFYLKKLEKIKPELDDKYYKKAKKVVDAIEDRKTFVHGDCHFKNIMVQNDELILIDMDTLSYGHPIFEFAQIYAPYCAFSEDDPGNSKRFFGIEDEDSKKLYNALVEGYFNSKDDSLKEKIKLVSYIHMIWWNRMNEPDNNKRLEGCRERLYKLLDQYDDVNI